MSKAVPESGLLGRLLGGPFGPKENCTVQSAATAAGGIGILFVSAIPAIYRLGLLSHLPTNDVGKLIALTACAGFYGVFFVIPLRKYYIVKHKLTFPTPAATAVTIHALHNSRTGAVVARKKSLALLWSFVCVFLFKVVSGYAPGVVSTCLHHPVSTHETQRDAGRSSLTGISVGLCTGSVSPASFRWTTTDGGSSIRMPFNSFSPSPENGL